MKNPNRLEEVLSDDDAFLQSINFPTERSPSPNMVSPDPDTPKKKKRKKGNDDNNCSGDKKRKKDNDDNNNSDSKRFKRS
jgi:hypothetical protein